MALANVNLKFGLNLKDFDSKLNKVNKSITAAGKKMTSIGKGLSVGLTAPILAAAGSALALANRVGQVADRLLDLEQITGISTDSIQEWQYVANQAGVSSETMTSAMEGLTKKLFDVTGAGNDGTKTLDQLGIAYKDASGQFLSGESIMDTLITRLSGMDNVVQRNAIGAKLFGGAWKDIAPILSFGTEGISNLRKEAHDLGIVMSSDSLNASNAFRMGVDKLKITFDGLTNQLGASFAPLLNDTIIPILQNDVMPLFKRFTDFVGGLIDRFQALSPNMQKIILGVGAFAVAIGPLLAGLGFFITTILPAMKAGLMVITALFSPLVLKIVAVTAVVGGLILVTKGVIDSWDTIKAYFGQLWDKIRLFFITGIAKTLKVFNDFTSKIGLDFSDTVKSLEGDAKKLGDALDAQPVITLGDVFGSVGDSIRNTFTSVKDSIVGSMSASKEAVDEVVDSANELGGGGGIKRTKETAIASPERGTPGMDITLPEGIQGVTDKLDEAAPLWYQKAQEMTDSFNQIINDGIINGIGTFAAGIGDLIAGTASIGDVGNMLLQTLGGMMEQLGKMAIGTGIAVEAIKEALTKLGGIGAIAAGVALIALSRVVTANVAGIAGGGGGGGPLGAPSSVQGARAMGGTVQMNQPYLVGERGPELFTPSGYGNITPNSQLSGGMQEIRVMVEGRLSGQDIILAGDRYLKTKGRTT